MSDVAPVPPLATPSVPPIVESVLVAVHVGTPFKRARTCPAVPALVVAKALLPVPYRSVPLCTAAQPVPPWATESAVVRPRRDVMSLFAPEAAAARLALAPAALVAPVPP